MTYEVAIVGGGPIGLELAAALKHAGVPSVQLEAGPIGATMTWWAPRTRFFSSPERLEIAGVPLVTEDQTKATAERYLAYLRSVVRQLELPVRTYERVTSIEPDDEGFVLRSRRSLHGVGGPEEEARARAEPRRDDDDDGGGPIVTRAKRVVLAHGNLHRPRHLGVRGEDLPHVSHFAGDPHRYFGRRLLVVGGKNSAVETALRGYRCGAHVTMSYRGERFDERRVKYWLRPEIEWLIDKGRIAWHPRTVPVRIDEETVTLGQAEGRARHLEIPADFVLLLTGYVQDPGLFEQLGLELRGDARAPVVNPESMETSRPGVYVAGTAAGGSQERARVFIENSHVHAERITRAITGAGPPWSSAGEYAALEES